MNFCRIEDVPSISEFRRRRRTYGRWKYNVRLRTAELMSEDGTYVLYEVDLDTCTALAGLLDWIFQVNNKQFVRDDDMRDLLNLFRDVINPQATMCSFGISQARCGVSR